MVVGFGTGNISQSKKGFWYFNVDRIVSVDNKLLFINYFPWEGEGFIKGSIAQSIVPNKRHAPEKKMNGMLGRAVALWNQQSGEVAETASCENAVIRVFISDDGTVPVPSRFWYGEVVAIEAAIYSDACNGLLGALRYLDPFSAPRPIGRLDVFNRNELSDEELELVKVLLRDKEDMKIYSWSGKLLQVDRDTEKEGGVVLPKTEIQLSWEKKKVEAEQEALLASKRAEEEREASQKVAMAKREEILKRLRESSLFSTEKTVERIGEYSDLGHLERVFEAALRNFEENNKARETNLANVIEAQKNIAPFARIEGRDWFFNRTSIETSFALDVYEPSDREGFEVHHSFEWRHMGAFYEKIKEMLSKQASFDACMKEISLIIHNTKIFIVEIDKNEIIFNRDRRVSFPSEWQARIAFDSEQIKGIEGTFLSHHFDLGEAFRERARAERWDAQKCALAELLFSAKSLPEWGSYTVASRPSDLYLAEHGLRGSNRETVVSMLGWLLGGSHIGDAAKKTVCQIADELGGIDLIREILTGQEDKSRLKKEEEGAEKRKLICDEFEGLRNEAVATLGKGSFGFLNEPLRKKIQSVAWLEGLDLMATETVVAWIGEAKKALDELSKAEPGAVQLEQRQNSGEILVGFVAWHRRGGVRNQGDGWVIRPDGSFRERDSDTVPRFKSDGTYRWDLIEPEELALRWEGGLSAEISHLPVSGSSDAQLETVAKIEQELGLLPGSFGLNSEAREAMEQKMQEIKAEYEKLPTDLQCLEGWGNNEPGCWDFLSIASQDGVRVREDDGTHKFVSRQDVASPTQCAGREAHVVFSQPCAGGVLELLVFHKFGQWQLFMRWREFVEGEKPSDVKEEKADDEPTGLASVEDINFLLLKFKK